MFGFLLLWLSDLSGSKILHFNTDLFLNCCSYSYASLHYPDERPVFPRLCQTLETYFQKHLLGINDGSWWLGKFFPSLFPASWPRRAVPLFPSSRDGKRKAVRESGVHLSCICPAFILSVLKTGLLPLQILFSVRKETADIPGAWWRQQSCGLAGSRSTGAVWVGVKPGPERGCAAVLGHV